VRVQSNSASIDGLADGLFDLFTCLTKTTQSEVFQALAELDLSMSQVRMLFLIEAAPQAPALHELAAQLTLSMAATGRAADALVRLGLVDRHEDQADRRVKRITLTGAARDLLLRLSAARREDMRLFAERLREDERVLLIEALTPILNRPEIRALTIGPGC
jgi:DNA-binding MarR family transcriptional regulator